MPEVHLPHLDDEEGDEDNNDTDAAANPRRRWWTPSLKIGLEVVLITAGVSLGLAGEQWRENREHRELAQASLRRFRTEFRANRAEVERVKDRHAKALAGLQAYLAAHTNELAAHLADPSKPIPGPLPDNVTDSAGVDFSAWDLALATQSLAYIDPDLVAAMSSAYRMQQIYQEAHRSIQEIAYSFTDIVFWLRGVTTYFGDAVLYEELMLKRYDDVLPRLDKAIGDGPGA